MFGVNSLRVYAWALVMCNQVVHAGIYGSGLHTQNLCSLSDAILRLVWHTFVLNFLTYPYGALASLRPRASACPPLPAEATILSEEVPRRSRYG